MDKALRPVDIHSALLGPRVLHEVVVQHFDDGGVVVSTSNFDGGGPLVSELAYDLLRFAAEPFGEVAHRREWCGTRQRLLPEPLWRDP